VKSTNKCAKNAKNGLERSVERIRSGSLLELRAALRQQRERYVLDIPGNTLMRVVGERVAQGRKASFFF
jgi:hypothetical protein